MTGDRRERAREAPVRLGSGRPQLGALGGTAEEQREHALAPSVALAGGLLLGGGVSLDRGGGKLIDVGEDRVGQRAENLRGEAGGEAGAGHAAPGHPRADPIGGLERVEAAPGAHLAAAQRHVDGEVERPRILRRGDERGELAQRVVHAKPDGASELALERPRVDGYLLSDHREDLLTQRGHLGGEQRGRLRREGPPRPPVESTHLHDKNFLMIVCPRRRYYANSSDTVPGWTIATWPSPCQRRSAM